jgi:translation initiation factor IF-2
MPPSVRAPRPPRRQLAPSRAPRSARLPCAAVTGRSPASRRSNRSATAGSCASRPARPSPRPSAPTPRQRPARNIVARQRARAARAERPWGPQARRGGHGCASARACSSVDGSLTHEALRAGPGLETSRLNSNRTGGPAADPFTSIPPRPVVPAPRGFPSTLPPDRPHTAWVPGVSRPRGCASTGERVGEFGRGARSRRTAEGVRARDPPDHRHFMGTPP